MTAEPENISACPFCRGETGYAFWVSEEIVADWGSDDLCLSGNVKDPATVVCRDCGVRIDRKRADGNA